MAEVVSIKEFMKTKKGTFTIEMSRFIKASSQTIFEILTDKTGLGTFMESEVECDFKIGSPIKFIWEMGCDDEKGVTVNSGTIINIVPNSLFSFTWGDENPKRNLPVGSTLVEFKIEEQKNGCLVTIIHYDLPSEHEANDHCGGWSEFLEKNTTTWI